jgi:NADPH:quinone reductase-like Zn-dependent oxidoreductase
MNFGTYAEFICLPEKAALAGMPTGLGYAEAAAIPFGGVTALYFLRDLGYVQAGQEVLVYGASGSVGVYAVQIARAFGARVTAVCSMANLEFVRSLGADEVIDYTREDFTQNGKTYDLIIDPVVGKLSFGRVKKALKPEGIYLAVAGGVKEFLEMAWTSIVGGKKVKAGTPPAVPAYPATLAGMLGKGQIRPVIDRVYPLEETAKAHRYADQRHKKGAVVIEVIPDGKVS